MDSDDEKSLDDSGKKQSSIVPGKLTTSVTRRKRSDSQSDSSHQMHKKRREYDAKVIESNSEKKMPSRPNVDVWDESNDPLSAAPRLRLGTSQNPRQGNNPNISVDTILAQLTEQQLATPQFTTNHGILDLLAASRSTTASAQNLTDVARNTLAWNPAMAELIQSARMHNPIMRSPTPPVASQLLAQADTSAIAIQAQQIMHRLPESATPMFPPLDRLTAATLRETAIRELTARQNAIRARATPETAAVMADGALSLPQFNQFGVGEGIPLSLPIILAIPEDNLKLSSQQLLLRHQIEAFKATEDDVSTHTRGRNKPIMLGQVGIRCRHCAHVPVGQRQKGSTYFPASLLGLYQAAQKMSVTHMQCGLCNWMPQPIRQEFLNFAPSKVASSGAGRLYWAEAAKKLGLIDTDEGIRFIRDTPLGISKLIQGLL